MSMHPLSHRLIASFSSQENRLVHFAAPGEAPRSRNEVRAEVKAEMAGKAAEDLDMAKKMGAASDPEAHKRWLEAGRVNFRTRGRDYAQNALWKLASFYSQNSTDLEFIIDDASRLHAFAADIQVLEDVHASVLRDKEARLYNPDARTPTSEFRPRRNGETETEYLAYKREQQASINRNLGINAPAGQAVKGQYDAVLGALERAMAATYFFADAEKNIESNPTLINSVTLQMVRQSPVLYVKILGIACVKEPSVLKFALEKNFISTDQAIALIKAGVIENIDLVRMYPAKEFRTEGGRETYRNFVVELSNSNPDVLTIAIDGFDQLWQSDLASYSQLVRGCITGDYSGVVIPAPTDTDPSATKGLDNTEGKAELFFTLDWAKKGVKLEEAVPMAWFDSLVLDDERLKDRVALLSKYEASDDALINRRPYEGIKLLKKLIGDPLLIKPEVLKATLDNDALMRRIQKEVPKFADEIRAATVQNATVTVEMLDTVLEDLRTNDKRQIDILNNQNILMEIIKQRPEVLSQFNLTLLQAHNTKLLELLSKPEISAEMMKHIPESWLKDPYFSALLVARKPAALVPMVTRLAELPADKDLLLIYIAAQSEFENPILNAKKDAFLTTLINKPEAVLATLSFESPLAMDLLNLFQTPEYKKLRESSFYEKLVWKVLQTNPKRFFDIVALLSKEEVEKILPTDALRVNPNLQDVISQNFEDKDIAVITEKYDSTRQFFQELLGKDVGTVILLTFLQNEKAYEQVSETDYGKKDIPAILALRLDESSVRDFLFKKDEGKAIFAAPDSKDLRTNVLKDDTALLSLLLVAPELIEKVEADLAEQNKDRILQLFFKKAVPAENRVKYLPATWRMDPYIASLLVTSDPAAYKELPEVPGGPKDNKFIQAAAIADEDEKENPALEARADDIRKQITEADFDIYNVPNKRAVETLKVLKNPKFNNIWEGDPENEKRYVALMQNVIKANPEIFLDRSVWMDSRKSAEEVAPIEWLRELSVDAKLKMLEKMTSSYDADFFTARYKEGFVNVMKEMAGTPPNARLLFAMMKYGDVIRKFKEKDEYYWWNAGVIIVEAAASNADLKKDVTLRAIEDKDFREMIYLYSVQARKSVLLTNPEVFQSILDKDASGITDPYVKILIQEIAADATIPVGVVEKLPAVWRKNKTFGAFLCLLKPGAYNHLDDTLKKDRLVMLCAEATAPGSVVFDADFKKNLKVEDLKVPEGVLKEETVTLLKDRKRMATMAGLIRGNAAKVKIEPDIF